MFLAAAGAAVSVAQQGGDVLQGISRSVAHLFNGGSSDVMSKVWKNIQAGDAWRFNAVAQKDGWHDISSGVKLSQEESDKRVTSVIAQYVGARRGEDGYWYDQQSGIALTSQQALDRWNATYGVGATPATVLQGAPRYVGGAVTVSSPDTASRVEQYVTEQVQSVINAARKAGDNVQAVATGAAAGAAAGAQTVVASQSVQKADMMRTLLWGIVIAVGAGLVLRAISKKGA